MSFIYDRPYISSIYGIYMQRLSKPDDMLYIKELNIRAPLYAYMKGLIL